jgi:RNA polymerase sigma factor (TIGR02999 family)
VQSFSQDSVALLTADFRRVERNPADELVEQFYAELRRLAAARMKGERLDHTWQTTALVNELYLELVRVRQLTTINQINQEDKAAFLGFAAHLMKRLLIHHARPLYRRAQKISVEDGPEPAMDSAEALQDVDDALSRLASIDPKFRSVVEMRVFEGLTSDEIASKLNCSRRSVASYWNFARRWLEKEWAGSAFYDE